MGHLPIPLLVEAIVLGGWWFRRRTAHDLSRLGAAVVEIRVDVIGREGGYTSVRTLAGHPGWLATCDLGVLTE